MKKILAIFMVTFLLLTFSVTAFAEDSTSAEEVVTEAADDSIDFTVDGFITWIKSHPEELSVLLSLIGSAILAASRNKKINSSIATVNNNAVQLATDSKAEMEAMKSENIKAMELALAEILKNKEERATFVKYLEVSRLANIELANEVAELLILANIPNSKKDELYARHLAAVNSIADAEAALEPAEENENAEDNEE